MSYHAEIQINEDELYEIVIKLSQRINVPYETIALKTGLDVDRLSCESACYKKRLVKIQAEKIINLEELVCRLLLRNPEQPQ